MVQKGPQLRDNALQEGGSQFGVGRVEDQHCEALFNSQRDKYKREKNLHGFEDCSTISIRERNLHG